MLMISPGGRMTALLLMATGRSTLLMDHSMEQVPCMQLTWMEMEM